MTAAIALRQIGKEVRVFERYPTVRPAGAGIMLAPNALRALETLGLTKLIREQGFSSPGGMAILDEKGAVLSAMPAGGDVYATVAIHRAELYRILLHSLPPGTVSFGKACLDMRQDDRGVTVRFSDNEEVHGSYVLAADGLHSVIRGKLFPSVRLRYAGYTCWRGVADCWPGTGSDSLFTESWGPLGRFGVIPLAHEQTYWFAVKNAAPHDQRYLAYGIPELLDTFGGYHAPVASILSATSPSQMIHNDIFDLDRIGPFVSGRTLLLGDAAHALTPNLGQGACQAIEDAVELGRCLTRHTSVPDAFRAYETARVARNSLVSRLSWTVGKLAQLESPLLCRLRNSAMKLTPPFLQRRQLNTLYDVDFTND